MQFFGDKLLSVDGGDVYLQFKKKIIQIGSLDLEKKEHEPLKTPFLVTKNYSSRGTFFFKSMKVQKF